MKSSNDTRVEKLKEELRSAQFAAEQAVREKNGQLEALRKEFRQMETSYKTIGQEFTDYKSKAAHALQTKEKIITDLKSGRVETDSDVMVGEVMQLRRERDSALTELEEKQALIDQMRRQSLLIETHAGVETEELKSKIEELQLTLQRERTSGSELREELTQVMQAKITGQREAEQKIKVLERQLQEKTQEAHDLQLRLGDESRKTEGGDGNKDLERKLASLRDSLVEKQSQIERLMIEKNSLSLRLETEMGRVMRLLSFFSFFGVDLTSTELFVVVGNCRTPRQGLPLLCSLLVTTGNTATTIVSVSL